MDLTLRTRHINSVPSLLFLLLLVNSSPERVDSRGSWKSQTTYFGVKLPGISSVGAQKRTLSRFAGSRSAPPGGAAKTSSQHAVRRHMQNEYKKDVLNSNSMNDGKPKDVTSWYMKIITDIEFLDTVFTGPYHSLVY